MKKIIGLGFFALSFFVAKAQNSPCFVGLDSLKGSYQGDCREGKANGEGKAIGIDTYEGTFKSGLPDGKGKYTWKNGDFYYGSWKKGQKDGKGELHLGDKVQYGFWKKNLYKGQYENPYIIHNTTPGVGRVEVSKMKGSKSSITIEVSSMTGNASLTEVRVQAGSYNTKAANKLSNKEVSVLQGVIFPFKAFFVFGSNSVEIELFEEGEWTVIVPIQMN